MLRDEDVEIFANLWLMEILFAIYNTPRHARVPHCIFIDELPVFQASFEIITRALAQVRKFRCRFVCAFQGTQLFEEREKDRLLQALISHCNAHFYFRHKNPVDAKFIGEIIKLPTIDTKKVKHVQTQLQQYQDGNELITLTDESESVSDAEQDGGSSSNAVSDTQSHSEGNTSSAGSTETTSLVANAVSRARSDQSGSSSGTSSARGSTETNGNSWSKTKTRGASITRKQSLVPRIRTREVVTATQFYTTDEQIIEAASELTTLPRGTAMLYVAGEGVSRVNTPLARNPLASTPRFAAKKIAQLRREGLRCPLCQGELVSTGLRGQTTCPHCQAPILLVRSRSREHASLALPAEYGAFIADSVVARRGKEAIFHGWHRSGHPEVVIKLRHQPGDTPPDKTRHPNVVRLLDSGTEVGFDYQVFEWAEGSELTSAAELFTSSERLSPREVVSPKKISPAKIVSAAPVQSEPPDPPQDFDATDMPSIGARWRGRFNQRFHEGLVRGLGIKGLGCSMPMARFLADGVCVSLYAICATMIAFQILGESIAAVAGAIPWLAWQWFWLRHYRCLLGWKTRTAEIIVATLMIALSLMNDAGFWSGVVAAVIVDTWVTAIVIWRTLRCRFGQRFSQPVAPVLQESDKPKPTALTWFEWILGSVIIATVSYWWHDGTKFYVATKGGGRFIETEHGRRITTDRRNKEQQVKKLTDAIAKSTDPLEQAKLYQQRAQAYRALGENDRAHTDEGRVQQLQLKNLHLRL